MYYLVQQLLHITPKMAIFEIKMETFKVYGTIKLDREPDFFLQRICDVNLLE